MIKYDLHCHILPQLDDGAKSVAESLELLHMEYDQGVQFLALTPHFYCMTESMDTFLQRRSVSFEKLMAGSHSLNCRLGAEVLLSPKLLALNPDLRRLTITDTDYILVELPFDFYSPYISEMLDNIITQQGLVPILAHVERYTYLREKPQLLLQLISQGCLAHVSADNILSRKDKGFCKACLHHDLAHFIASDTHSTDKRPPQMSAAFNKLDPFLQEKVEKNARLIWANEYIFSDPDSYPKKGLLCYK